MPANPDLPPHGLAVRLAVTIYSPIPKNSQDKRDTLEKEISILSLFVLGLDTPFGFEILICFGYLNGIESGVAYHDFVTVHVGEIGYAVG